MRRFYSTTEAADRLGLSASYLAKLRCRGGGPVYSKLGRRVVYSRSALESWAAQHERGSTSENPGAA